METQNSFFKEFMVSEIASMMCDWCLNEYESDVKHKVEHNNETIEVCDECYVEFMGYDN